MVDAKPVWRLILVPALLVAVAGCTNTFKGVERDLDNLFREPGDDRQRGVLGFGQRGRRRRVGRSPLIMGWQGAQVA